MDNYEMRWNERKGFLVSSLIIGSIAAILVIIWGIITTGVSDVGEFFQVIFAFVFLDLLFTAIIVMIRMIKNNGSIGGGFAINMLNGLWTTVINAFTGSWLGIVIGLLMMVVFFWLFLFVAAIYAIYIPISTIYIYVMYKKQVGPKASSVSSEQ